ncbi:PREDICTED: BEL1-like homeodomain protein 7 isoform X1 [Nicotiana attenuata]|uniref:Bel1-like homeodomain protein 6 n=1 Tax=Nicotiana attenuata TaxID=49451 RepID=A0A1J6IJI0_NICAT|nr:PREDICTED: BEL1-like homeodomain protein 7 isoform X1 [Nicotiana attenuata]XP_019243802.1 PREDICTED: BEL1-like homeodomain protein 7 isoform X1 [Nicotiana attenuata]OIT05030.1 bel1-like homeodomain protein 6 [Nicotiana attenuata]
MSAYYSNLSNQREVLPMSFLPDQKFDSYHSAGLSDSSIHLNQHSSTVSYSELPAQNYGEVQTIRGKDEMLFIPPTSESGGMQPIGRSVNASPNFLDNSVMMDPRSFPTKQFFVPNVEQSLQNQGLSLSLGTQVPPSLHVYSYQDDYTNSSLSSLVGTHVLHSEQGSENKESKVAEYLSFDLSRGTRAANNPQNSMSLRDMNSGARSIYNSKYLKAAQDLLDEVVNVQEALKQSDRLRNFNLLGQNRFEEADLKSSCSASGISGDHNNSTKGELSPADRHDLESKMTKLFSMLDEVDRKYKEYYQQMQAVVSSFEMVAGLGAAKPYTSLALKTISRQFRCLRDAIKKQIQVTRRSLGEQGDSQGERLYRLRYVDQQLRQQRSLQQFGMMRQPWRPQRGLPETAVSVLRAWLFEHFLHPYPKDSEKIMLARQTGLTRSQVANWFINARVRLWKPMIEDMYKEEFGEAEAGSGASPDRAPEESKEKSIAENTGEEIPESFTTPAVNCSHLDPSDESSNVVTNVQNNSFITKFSFQDGAYEHEKIDAVNTYHASMLGDIMGNQVSLALRLQNSQIDQQPISGRTQLAEDDKTGSTLDISKGEYYYIDPVNQQERFSGPHLLSDFVA